MSFDGLSTLLSAIASFVSVVIAAYLVVQGRRESPDIRFVSTPVKIVQSDWNRTDLTRDLRLPFQNVGARAGSLIHVKLVCPLEEDSGKISATVGMVGSDIQLTYLPVVLQPYTTTLVNANIILKGIPNVKTLLATLGNEAQIQVKYLVSTKPNKKAKTGIDEREGYIALISIEEPTLKFSR